MTSRTEKVLKSDLCIGCGACASGLAGVPTRMNLSPAGFLRPSFGTTLPPVAAARLDEVCPAVGLTVEADDAATVHPLWGPLLRVRTGWAQDADVRFKGSSGGGISALLIHLLESGQVDFVVHVAASETDPLRNERRISRTRDQVLQGAGSRYAPAALLETVEALFERGERFAFVGKPCDVAAMRAYLAQRPEQAPQVVALLSFMCAGIPSMQGTHDVLAALGTHEAEVLKFQYRGDGWPGYATARTRDGRELRMDYNRSWGQILGPRLQLRCKLCPDGTGEAADVVCADAWHGKDGYPDFTEQDGRSLVLTRSTRGEALVQRAEAAGALVLQDSSADDIAAMQPYQVTRKQVVLGRWLAVVLRLRVVPRFRGLHLLAAMQTGGLVQALRHAWGTFKRVRRANAA